jgi:hypothetical protein
MISNEPGQKSTKGESKVYLHGLSQTFTFDDLDIIILSRLGKQRDENKFNYLYESYQRIGEHLVARRKNKATEVLEMKTITARYFVTCLTAPDTFELNNDTFTTHDTVEWIQMGVPNPEDLGSGKDYKSTKM